MIPLSPRDTTTHLYRFFGADNQLLYVGITYNPFTRFSQHKQQKPWSDIKRIDLENFPTRQEAEAAEKLAIQTEHPEWNIKYSGERLIPDEAKPGTSTVNGLVGHFFHSFHTEDDGCKLVNWQGQIIAQVEPGVYMVETYDWLMGSTYNRLIVPLTDMADWSFYDDDEWMRNTYHNVFSQRSDRHSEHEKKLRAV